MIVVFGATGNTGRHLVTRLTRGGHAVRCAVRDEARARAALGDGPALVRADLTQPATLDAALEGADAVYCAVGGPTGTPQLVEAERALVDAARRARVSRYVKVSGIDAAPDAPARIQRWHGEAERHLARSGVPATVLRPGFFMQNLLGLAPAIASGVLPVPTGDARASHIDARDIADVAYAALTGPGHEGACYTLTGPAALSHAEVAAALSQALESTVRFVDVPPSAFCEAGVGAGMPRWFAELLTDVYVEVFARGGAERVTDDVRRVTGRAPRSLADFLREHRGAFAP